MKAHLVVSPARILRACVWAVWLSLVVRAWLATDYDYAKASYLMLLAVGLLVAMIYDRLRP